MAFRTGGFLLAVDESFELVVAFFADVFEDGHDGSGCSLY
jgi:hypothetical protein